MGLDRKSISKDSSQISKQKQLDVASKQNDLAATKKAEELKKQTAADYSADVSSIEGAGAVFGSFNLKYPTSGIEKEREDGATLINLMPECRVFICGGEISKDIVSVAVNGSIDNVSSCTITIANPRGKYNISTSDLVSGPNGSLWREDKSIQATYDYDWLKKQVPATWGKNKTDPGNMKSQGSKLKKIGNTIVGKQITATISSVAAGVKNVGASRTQGFTQMLYEIKHYSGFHKTVGETIFDYRDTVQVFFKGRFSTYWYFGFSGVVEAIDNSYAYGSSENIVLKCTCAIGILRRKKWTEQGSLLARGNMEDVFKKTDTARSSNIFTNPSGSFSEVIKSVMWVGNKDYYDKVENSHFFYTPSCDSSINWKAEQKAEKELIAAGGQMPLRATPYTDPAEYYRKFKSKHPFNMQHKDLNSTTRYNYGKQFREFYLREDEASTPQQETLPLEAVGLEFIGGRALYVGEKELNKPVRGNIPAEPPANALAVLQRMLEHMKNVLNEATSPVSWKVVGHTALIFDSEGAMRVKDEFRSQLRGYDHVDFGPYIMDYAEGWYVYDEKHNNEKCFSRKINLPKFNNPGKINYDGAGQQVSEERAHRVLMDLYTLAKKFAANDTKYNKVKETLKSMVESGNKASGVGRWEPRNAERISAKFNSPKTVEEALALAKLYLNKDNSKAEINNINRFVELVPEQSSYTRKAVVKPKGNSDQFTKDPHSLHFSPSCAVYLQLNEINIDEFTPENLEVFYNTSVRYWLKGPGTTIDKKQLGNVKATGWKHVEGFGVCGIHPAMTYDFIDNFNILPAIHAETMSNIKLLDGCTLTPLELLKEPIFGIGTELDNFSWADNEGIGTQRNYFRPRLFLVLPKKFRFNNPFPKEIAEMIIGMQKTASTWDILQQLILRNEYTIYSSPAGDIFIEPLMHDFHPLDFYAKLDEKAICNRRNVNGKWVYEGAEIFFRTSIHTREKPVIAYRADKAYIFNTKINHPFFITNKDLRRVTDTIKPENLISHVTLVGSYIDPTSDASALANTYVDSKAKGFINRFLDSASSIEATSNESGILQLSGAKHDPFMPGMYFANGFSTMQTSVLSTVNSTDSIQKEIDEKLKLFRNKLEINFYKYKNDASVGNIIYTAEAGVKKIIKDSIEVYNDELYKFILQRKDEAWAPPSAIEDLIPESSKTTSNRQTQDSPNAGGTSRDGTSGGTTAQTSKQPVDALTSYETALIYSQAPNLFELYEYLYKWEKTGDRPPAATYPIVLDELNINTLKQGNGLLSQVVSKITYGVQNTMLSQDSDTALAIAHLTADLTNEGQLGIPNRSYTNAVVPVVNQLIQLYELIVLSVDSEENKALRDLNDELTALRRRKESLGKVDGYLTRADLKAYEMAQLYDPSKDFVTRYGWNPGPEVTTTFMRNGAEAEAYCKVLFDKINSNAFEIKCDVIGRPELFLNRPYYVEKNQTIGLLSSYGISYTASSPFASNVNLTYLRRNALTYKYTNGNLDKIVAVDKNSKNNEFFNNKALRFYKSIFESYKVANRYKMLDNLLPIGGASSAAKVVVSKFSKKREDKVVEELDGIYVAHDWIGHTDYDKKYNDLASSVLRTERILPTEDTSEVKYVANLGGSLITREQSMLIVERNNNLHTAFLVLQSVEKEIEEVVFKEADLYERMRIVTRIRDDAQKQQADAENDIKVISGQPQTEETKNDLKRLRKVVDAARQTIDAHNKLRTDIETNLNSITAKSQQLNANYAKITKLIYGSVGAYSPRSVRSKNSSGDVSTSEAIRKETVVLQKLEQQQKDKLREIDETEQSRLETIRNISRLVEAGVPESDPVLIQLRALQKLIEEAQPKLDKEYTKISQDLISCKDRIANIKESAATAYSGSLDVGASYTVQYEPTSARRTMKVTFSIDKVPNLFYQLYMAIPEKDINKVNLRQFCVILDDEGALNAKDLKLTGKIDKIPLYIQYNTPRANTDLRGKGSTDAPTQGNIV